MRFALYTGVGVLSAACGGVTTSGQGTGGAAGHSEAGRAGNSGSQSTDGGGVGFPGSSGAGGASLGTGGPAGSPNASNDASPNMGSMGSKTPSGSITSCSGKACPGGPCGCPAGACGQRPCSTTITSSYQYCAPHANGTLCLAAGSRNGPERWLVYCTDGSTMLIKECPHECDVTPYPGCV
jgi:hypothetical protein